MKKPFDSLVDHQRDDTVPLLEFRYKGNRMSQGELVGTILALSFGVTAPLAIIPLVRSRVKKNFVRVDKVGLTVDKNHYERDHVQRVRTWSMAQQGMNTATGPSVNAVVFDYGTKRKLLAARLSEPELLWIYAEVQDFIGRHWTEVPPQRF